ncbi:DNA polymerase I [Clostridium sp. HBUAS56010]|uniref:DNA polymerase I n=1 Tax=Clostridium sp. HBUAS56010 TaxID=2571127 RepID=UPI0011784CB4|nr:DNA polymerase I [Clostridium sp. HBUAS56010]
MSRKRIVLIDGDSMLREAFYGLPVNAADGVCSLIKEILDQKGADYLAIAFSAESEECENGVTVLKELKEQQKLLKEQSGPFGASLLLKDDARACDLLSTLAAKRKEEEDIVILSADKKLLQTVEDHVTVRMADMGEEGLILKDYTLDAVQEKYGLEPEQLKGMFALCTAEGIGKRSAARLIKEFGNVSNLYDQIESVDSVRVKEILKQCESEVKQEEKTYSLSRDCDIELDYSQSVLETEIRNIMDMEFVPSDFPEEEQVTSEFPGDKVVTDLTQAEELFSRSLDADRIGLQLVIEDKAISALSLCFGETECYCVVPEGFMTGEYLAGKAEELCNKSGHVTVLDLKSQLPFLHLDEESQVFDAGVAAYLLSPLNDSYSYQELAMDYMGKALPSKTDLIGKSTIRRGLEENRDQAAACVCSMSYVAYECGQRLRQALKETDMETLYYEIELPLIYSLFSMESVGIKVERGQLKEYGDRLKVKIAELEQKIHEETGETFNINSPKQLGEVLFEHMKIPGGKKTKTGYSTAADVLEKLASDYPVVSLILDYRQLTKLNSTYADGLAAYIGPDERIHGTFNQTITATGRISSTEPNLQNIPVKVELGREIRKVFVPKEGCVFVDADYSQIELRVLAHMSGDQRLIGAYRQAEDIHAITASEVFHVPLDQVTSLQRRNAKAVNFGIVYGISSFGLSEGLSITRKEASEYIEKYFETYPGVKSFLDGLVKDAKEHGYAVSMFGRRRPVPELKSSNFMQRSFGERAAMNSPIQGTAADIMKIAMIRVDRALKKQGLKSRIVLQVHDELLIETYIDELDQVKKLLTEEMKHAADLDVSLEVEANVGKSWFDAK